MSLFFSDKIGIYNEWGTLSVLIPTLSVGQLVTPSEASGKSRGIPRDSVAERSVHRAPNKIRTISSVAERSVHIGKATGPNPVSSTIVQLAKRSVHVGK
jgi:hypothetical protein